MIDSLRKLDRYFHTLRYLKPRQFLYRARNYIAAPPAEQKPLLALRSAAGTKWKQGAKRTPKMVGATQFVLLNRILRLPEVNDWNDPTLDKLCLYHLHYFEDLNAENADERSTWHRALIHQWILANPPGDTVAWDPYPTSIRIVNWIKWALAGSRLEPVWLESLAIQARWVSRRLEYHLLGNHLFSNAKCLVFAGLYFVGREADRWLSIGTEILASELPEQVLSDGGQVERSPMYHALALEDLLDLVNISESYSGHVSPDLGAKWRDTAERMLYWLRAMCHPDGEIVLFNDAAFGVAPTLDELEAYAVRMGIASGPILGTLIHLQDSGYVRAQLGPAVAFFDVAPIGPDHLPAHGHADTLGFELSLGGHRWFVDSGCSHYRTDEERIRQRGTAAHNTVTVDSQDSSEVWSSFRVARRARVREVAARSNGSYITVSAMHDGYRRLPTKVTHHRCWRLSAEGLDIDDRLEGEPCTADAWLHCHPSVSLAPSDGGTVTLRLDDRSARLSCSGGDVSIHRGTWHPEFGKSVPNWKIRLAFHGKHLVTRLQWS